MNTTLLKPGRFDCQSRRQAGEEAPYYPLYVGEKLWTIMPAGYILQQHAETFTDFPPRQAPADFNPQQMLNSVLNAAAGGIGNK